MRRAVPIHLSHIENEREGWGYRASRCLPWIQALFEERGSTALLSTSHAPGILLITGDTEMTKRSCSHQSQPGMGEGGRRGMKPLCSWQRLVRTPGGPACDICLDSSRMFCLRWDSFLGPSVTNAVPPGRTRCQAV